MEPKKVVVKIGSALNLIDGKKEKKINQVLINNIANQMCKAMDQEIARFIAVISGAIPLGKIRRGISPKDDIDQAILSHMGQPDLYAGYRNAFELLDFLTLERLLDEEDLERDYTLRVLYRALSERITPIVNYPDGKSPREIPKDNDETASQVAVRIEADILIILSKIKKGVQCPILNKDGLECEDGIIKKVRAELITDNFIVQIDNGLTSRNGSKGIRPKMLAARDACFGGVKEVWIVDGETPEIITRILSGEHIGTLIVP